VTDDFASLKTENPRSGEVTVLYELKIGEVGRSVFAPPPGANVVALPGLIDPMEAARRAVK